MANKPSKLSAEEIMRLSEKSGFSILESIDERLFKLAKLAFDEGTNREKERRDSVMTTSNNQ